MSTNSFIGMINTDGSVQTIYCHFDGYLEYNGKLLLESYQDKGKVIELVNLGDISSLGKFVAPDNEQNHTFLNPQEEVTVAYMRDRGEKNCEAQHWRSVQSFANKYKNSYCAYAYLYDLEKEQWLCNTGYDISYKGFESLEEVLERNEIEYKKAIDAMDVSHKLS